ncbi:class I SAM-dependent methyltransferase [Nocardioides conyzicola]
MGRAAGRLRGRAPVAAPPVVGIVEHFSHTLLTGWVSVPPGTPPTRITLRVGQVDVCSTYATPGGAMSGSTSVRAGKARRPGRGDPMLPGPAKDRRNSRAEIRTFSFRLREIWDYCGPDTQVRVVADGQPLPINQHGMFLRPRTKGTQTPADLRDKLASGYVLGQWGRVQLSKRLDTEWQAAVLALYERVRALLRADLDYDAFVIYGTLLGAVRDGGYIGHDVDFDAAYVSRARTGPEAADELVRIALALVADGLRAEAHPACLHIVDPDNPDHRIDLFHTYFDADGRLCFPFGVAGSTDFTESQWSGTAEIDLPGGTALAPRDPEALIAHLYGADWRLPKPGFNWDIDRTSAALDGRLSVEQRTKVYWADFYARTEYTTGSTFFEFVSARPDTAGTVVDIGCGDGRDSCAFGTTDRRVLGLDQSPVGIEHAQKRAADLGLDRVEFRTCDVASVDDLGAALDVVRDPDGAPVLFYLRFFLHAIREEVQAALLDAIDAHARPGDAFAAEFRTDQDARTTKVHTRHYRRFQNGPAFVADLRGRGWAVEHEEEGTGLSPYGEEDPVLMRVVAHRL